MPDPDWGGSITPGPPLKTIPDSYTRYSSLVVACLPASRVKDKTRNESHHGQLCLSQTPLWLYTALGTVGHSSFQPYALHGTAEYVPAFMLSNNNKMW